MSDDPAEDAALLADARLVAANLRLCRHEIKRLRAEVEAQAVKIDHLEHEIAELRLLLTSERP